MFVIGENGCELSYKAQGYDVILLVPTLMSSPMKNKLAYYNKALVASGGT